MELGPAIKVGAGASGAGGGGATGLGTERNDGADATHHNAGVALDVEHLLVAHYRVPAHFLRLRSTNHVVRFTADQA